MVNVNLNFSNPIFTIIAGVIITFAWMFVPIFGYMGPLVGGFVATYFAKEKNIVYGVYLGIIITIIFFISGRYLNPIEFYSGLIIAFLIFLPAIIGSYLGKKAYKRYKQNNTTNA